MSEALAAAAGATCRVCHDGHSAESLNEDGERSSGELIAPCLCDGSVRYVHQRCLNQWRLEGAEREDRATRCELCKFAYLYEVVWSSRSGDVGRHFARGACVVVPIALVVGFLRIFDPMQTVFMDVVLASAWLGLWALVDLLPTVGTRWGSVAADRLVRAAQTPTGVAEARRATAAQTKAERKAESQARTLSQMRAALAARPSLTSTASPPLPPPVLVRAPTPEELPQATDVELVVPGVEVAAQGGAAEGELARGNLQGHVAQGGAAQGGAARVVSADELSDDGSMVEFEGYYAALTGSDDGSRPDLAPRQRAASRVAPYESPSPGGGGLGSAACIVFSLCGVFLLSVAPGAYLLLVAALMGNSTGYRVVWTFAVLGSTYWGVAFVLALLAIFVGPRSCDPRRGPDGFYVVRNLTTKERAALAAAPPTGGARV